MFCKIKLALEGFLAVSALERPVLLVVHHVSPESRLSRESQATFIALIGFVPCVNVEMVLQVSHPSESFRAVLTLERLCVHVNHHVVIQSGRVAESMPTLMAHVRFHPVAQQVVL